LVAEWKLVTSEFQLAVMIPAGEQLEN